LTDDARVAQEERSLARLEEFLGYVFRDRSLLETALRHDSYAHEVGGSSSNERLEFLGDSVIGLAVAHLLYDAHPRWAEGELSRALHNLVDKRALAGLARSLELGPFIELGRSERQSGGAEKEGILADAMEAVIGAIFLDGGLAPVMAFTERAFASAMVAGAMPAPRDPKTHLNEWVMANFGEFPTYECIWDSGVDDDEDRFTVQVLVKGEEWGHGIARSKRLAEAAAARQALERRSELEATRASAPASTPVSTAEGEDPRDD
jgi:ribonuclease-3